MGKDLKKLNKMIKDYEQNKGTDTDQGLLKLVYDAYMLGVNITSPIKKPYYIVLEGADGTGKTTLAKNLAKQIDAEYTFEPFSLDYQTKYLREQALTKEMLPLAREYLLLANRALGYQDIEKKINQGISIVSDRSFISGAVYAYMEGIPFQDWYSMAKPLLYFAREKTEKIHPIFILCTNSQYRNKTNMEDRYDSKPKEFHDEVQDVFKKAFDYFKIPYIEFNISFNRTPESNLWELTRCIFKPQR